jgi:sec-independent protein translocase protein TatB
VFNLQGSEIIFILLLALVVLGPEKLPGAVKRAMQTYAELRKLGTGFQDEFKAAIDQPMREMRETADLIKDQADPKKFVQDAERAAEAAAAADRADAELAASSGATHADDEPTGTTDPSVIDDAAVDPFDDPFDDPIDDPIDDPGDRSDDAASDDAPSDDAPSDVAASDDVPSNEGPLDETEVAEVADETGDASLGRLVPVDEADEPMEESA